MRGFICSIVPNQFVVKLKAPQAPNNFCFDLIGSNIFDQIVSLIPPSYFDSCIKKTDGYIVYMQGNEKANILFKRIEALINSVKGAWMLRKFDSVWFYNICSSNVLAYLLLRFIFRTPVYAIFLDYTTVHSRLSVSYYFPWLYKKAKGVISLSQRTTICNKRLIYKAGVILTSKIKEPQLYRSKRKLNFLFSGSLNNHTGFPLALEVFKQLPHVDLYISGNGKVDIEDLKYYPNIHYLGYLEYRDYLKLYDKIDVCLSLRNPDYEENIHNFPSKIIEYFAYGKIVLSTLAYPELEDFNYVKSSYSVGALKQCVNALADADYNELNEFCDNKDAMLAKFSECSWNKAINEIEQKYRF